MDPIPFPPDRCPLCGTANQCAMERERLSGEAQGPCWCTQAQFTQQLLARVPSSALNRACICAACVAREAESLREAAPARE